MPHFGKDVFKRVVTRTRVMSIILVIAFVVASSQITSVDRSDWLGLFGNRFSAAASEDDGLTYKVTGTTMTVSGTNANYFGFYNWGDYATTVTDVTVSGTIKTIPNNAFSGFTKLKRVTVGQGVIQIGSGVFDGCTSLDDVNLPGTLLTVGAYAFRGCTALKSGEIPGAVTTIGEGVFSGCTSLEFANLSFSLEAIPKDTFLDCTNLRAVDMPQKVGNIDSTAFDNCVALKSIDIPAGVVNVPDMKGAKALEFVSVPDSASPVSVWRLAYCNPEAKLGMSAAKQQDTYTYTDGQEEKTIKLAQFNVTTEAAITSASSNSSGVITINRGKTIQLSAGGTGVKWSCLNPFVGDVNENGLVTGISGGTTQVLATLADGSKGMYRVDVIASATGAQFGTLPNYMSAGTSAAINLVLEPAGSTDENVVLQSSNTSVGTVAQRTFYANAPGTTTVSVLVNGRTTASAQITVQKPTMSTTNTKLVVGTAGKLSVKGSNTSTSWESSNPAAAIVDHTGVVTAIAEGYACIIAKTGGSAYYCDVNVLTPLQMKIDGLQSKYPKGYYWNNHTPSKTYPAVSEFPCTDHKTGRYQYCKGQCAGFAMLLSDEVFGKNAPKKAMTAGSVVKSGDYLRQGHHSVFIIKVVKAGEIYGYNKAKNVNLRASSAFAYIAECNWDYKCGIDWYATRGITVGATSFTRY